MGENKRMVWVLDKNMENQNGKWNTELLYAGIFLITAIIWLALMPLLPYNLPITTPNTIVIIFFLLCATFVGIKSLIKTFKSDNRTIFQFVFKSLPGFLALIIILISFAITATAVNVRFFDSSWF